LAAVSFADADSREAAESTIIGFDSFFSTGVSAVASGEFRPTMYPIVKNTPSSTTTMKNTLKSCLFPRINSNSPSSFLGMASFSTA